MLTKTDFLWYLDAPMHLWAKSHDQLEKTSHTLYEQHLIQQGQQVEALARDYIEKVLLLNEKGSQLLWQPNYDDGQYQIRADALIVNKESNAYDLYEIKSSTSVKTNHVYDLAFQVLLLESILILRRVYIIHIDNTYQHGTQLDLDRFFTFEEISQKLEKHREDVDQWRREALALTQKGTPHGVMTCTKPQSCPCPSLCHPNLPDSPIYNIPYIGKKAIQLREMGVTAIEDIPSTFNLNIKQRKHTKAVQTNQPIIDNPSIRQSLSTLRYPLYFLDYETFNPAVPLFPNYRPYEHIVFQYSLFLIKTPQAEPEHYDFLHTQAGDPAPLIVPNLISHLGPQGSVVVWNQSFEAHRNKDLAEHCPEFDGQLLGINDRLYDLMQIFKDGHYVHPDFHGSASLKAVLPVLCPNLGYQTLEISSGEQAMLTWYWLQMGQIPEADRSEIKEAMKAYCKLDTYGMVAILNKLLAL